jgi:hypothetical protein
MLGAEKSSRMGKVKKKTSVKRVSTVHPSSTLWGNYGLGYWRNRSGPFPRFVGEG